MKETLVVIAGTLAFLISIGQVDPNMTVGEFVGLYSASEELETPEELPTIVIDSGSAPTVVLEVEEPATEEIILTPVVEEEVIEPEPVLELAPDNEIPKEEKVLPGFYSEGDVAEVASVIAAEARGRDTTQKAAVGWCLLNRVDAWGISIATAANQAGAFEQLKPTDEDLSVAKDVLDRWSSEKQGNLNSGRVLPADYKYFSGNGKENRFREEYESKDHYNWSLYSPY
ncbi:hypothetical protein IJ103_03230 [Candidatus Saccharibacteria bacterium]|nr:hypothetical protein [Candidatus Saccharibacteria bacterium]